MSSFARSVTAIFLIILVFGCVPNLVHGRASAAAAAKKASTAVERLVDLILTNAFGEAHELAVRLLADPGLEAPTLAVCGLAVLKSGRVREAEALFEPALSGDPDNPEAHLGMGRLARIRNDNEAALKHLRRAVPAAAFWGEALRQLWKAAWERGVVSDLFEIGRLADERCARESEPVPSWLTNNLAQVQGLEGRRLYHLEGRFERLKVPLIPRSEDARIRMIAMRLNGRGEYPFDIDSASADFLTVSPLLAEELGLPLTGNASATGVGTASAPVRFTRLDTVELGGLVFKDVPVMVSDLHTFRGQRKGLLGTGLLKRFNVTIDAEAGIMDLYPLDRPDLLAATIDRSAVAADVPLYLYDATMIEASPGGAPPGLYAGPRRPIER